MVQHRISPKVSRQFERSISCCNTTAQPCWCERRLMEVVDEIAFLKRASTNRPVLVSRLGSAGGEDSKPSLEPNRGAIFGNPSCGNENASTQPGDAEARELFVGNLVYHRKI